MAGNSGVEHLISIAKRITKGTMHTAVITALGEAGGASARGYLIEVIDGAASGSPLQFAAIAALGRASRE